MQDQGLAVQAEGSAIQICVATNADTPVIFTGTAPNWLAMINEIEGKVLIFHAQFSSHVQKWLKDFLNIKIH